MTIQQHSEACYSVAWEANSLRNSWLDFGRQIALLEADPNLTNSAQKRLIYKFLVDGKWNRSEEIDRFMPTIPDRPWDSSGETRTYNL